MIRTDKSVLAEKIKANIYVAICCAIFIFLTNAVWIGGFQWAYGVPGHSISALMIMALFLRIYLKSKPHLATFILVYIFTSIPFYFLSTAQNFIGLERSLKIQARTITDGNTAAITLSILLVLLATIATSFKRKSAKYICIGLSLTLWIAFLIHFIVITFYGVNYGAGPTGPAIYAIVQTNPVEAYEYILSQGKITLSLIIGIILLLPLICYLMLMQHIRMELNDLEYKFVPFKRLYQRLSFNNLFISVCALFMILNLNLYDALNSYVSAYTMYSQQQEFKKIFHNRDEILDSINIDENHVDDGLHVVLIGESLVKDHMSAYGYHRKTTPWLDSMHDEKNFFLFKNAYSNHVISAYALSMILTSLNQYDTSKVSISQCPTIIEIARKAGFEVSWGSNHTYYGVTAKPHSLIADGSDNKIWINEYSNGEFKMQGAYDGELEAVFKKFLKSDKKKRLIFIHLFGSHAEYNKRYPKSFNKWSGGSATDCYDNSVLYEDDVIRRLYELAMKQPDLRTITFFPDHGEEVGFGHTPDAFSYPMTRIPFWIAFSEEYAKDNPQIVEAVKNNIDKTFSNDAAFDIICGLTGITSHNYYREDLDITSNRYGIKPEDVKIINFYRAVDDPRYKQ